MTSPRARRPLVVVVVLLACLLTACGEVVTLSERELDLELQPTALASTVLDGDGNRLAVLRREYRERVRLDDVPAVLVDAVLVAEDRRFWEHGGVDARALTRAALRNLVAGEVVEGGSTITQQLVELRFMPPTVDTVETKATEAALALELERQYPKEWILEEYLNSVYLGGGAHGVGAAARSYFRRDVADLTLPQAALLAGLIRTPGTADPRVSPAAATARRDLVLGRMAEVGVITEVEAAAAAADPVSVHEAPSPPDRREPGVVDLAVRQLLGDPSFGRDEASRWRRLTGGGLTVHTTIDPTAQSSAREALTGELGDTRDAEVPDGALVTLDPTTGRILAVVQSLPYERLQFQVATDGVRQPGSVVKGFTLVAALVDGVGPDAQLDARGGTMPATAGAAPWSVRGTGRRTRSLQDAIAWSDNAVFARLGLSLGVPTVAATARALGVEHPLGDQPAVLLGGTATCCTPLDLASAYATIGALGTHHTPTIVSHVTDADDRVVWSADDIGRPAVDAVAAWEAATALTGVVTNGTGRAAALPGHVVAGKTGTTNQNSDGWFVGTTPTTTTAVWVGHHEGRRTARVAGVPVTGGGAPARIFATHMRRLLGPGPGPTFSLPPSRTVTVEVDVETGLRASPWCGQTERRVFPDSRVPTASCPSPAPPPPPRPEPPPPSPTGGSPTDGAPRSDPDGDTTPDEDDSTTAPDDPTPDPSPTPTPPPPGPSPSPEPTPTTPDPSPSPDPSPDPSPPDPSPTPSAPSASEPGPSSAAAATRSPAPRA